MEEKNNNMLYEKYLENYQKARKEGFNIEAICIIYAILENDLYEFLYLSGCVNNKNETTKRFRKDLRKIWSLKEKAKFQMKKISVKRKYIIGLLDFVENNNIEYEKSHQTYFDDLKEKLKSNVDFPKVRKNFKKMETWCDERNKIIHGLLNTNYEKQREKIENCAKDGLELVIELNEIINKYRNGTDLREKYKIQDVK